MFYCYVHTCTETAGIIHFYLIKFFYLTWISLSFCLYKTSVVFNYINIIYKISKVEIFITK